jgi:alcohol dehydrogenase
LYADDDPGRRARAEAMGAESAAIGAVHNQAEQFDIVVEAAGTEAGLEFAVRSTAPNGVLTGVAIHFADTTPMPLRRAYYKGLTFCTGRVNARPAIPHVLSCMTNRELEPRHAMHRIANFADAPDAMTDPGPKLVFVRE